MNRRDFLKGGLAAIGALYLPKGYSQDKGSLIIPLKDQYGNSIIIPVSGTISGNSIYFNNGTAKVALPNLLDVNGDGKSNYGDAKVVSDAARGDPAQVLNAYADGWKADVNGDGGINLLDIVAVDKTLQGDSTRFNPKIPAGKSLAYLVSVPSVGGYVGVDNLPVIVTSAGASVNMFKLEELTDKYLKERYANNLDLYANLASDKKWSSIDIDFGNYSFANINHSQIMREEALKLNSALGFNLFKENSTNPNVIVDYSTEQSKYEVTLWDGNKNPAAGKILKKKSSGAENWSRAEAQRLLVSLALGKEMDDLFFPDEYVAVEIKDQRIPAEVVNALKAMYKTGISVSNMREYEQKPQIIVDGKAEINSPIKFIVYAPDGSTGHSLEYLIAQKDTREFWSAESADAQPTYQTSDGNRHIYTFNTKWPGLRRFLTKVQKDGKTLQGQKDVQITTDKEPGYLKSFNLIGYLDFMQNNPDMYILSTLNRLKENGANMITLIPEWYLDDYTKTNIHPLNGFSGLYSLTWPDELIKKTVNYAKDFGMKVMFRPNIIILGGPKRWMAELLPDNGNWDTLFESHKNYLLYYANLGQQLGVDYLSVGAELNSMTLPNWRGIGVPDPDPRWRKIINEVRKVYNGKLTLSLPSNQYGHEDDISGVSFWDALDLIGFEPYFGLTGDKNNPGKKEPLLYELTSGFMFYFNKYISPISKNQNKKIIITEANYYSFNGVNNDPTGTIFGVGSEIDWKEQADCYNTMLHFFTNNNSLEAMNIWPGFIYADSNTFPWYGSWDKRLTEPDKILDWLYGKPAEKIIQANWKKNN